VDISISTAQLKEKHSLISGSSTSKKGVTTLASKEK
jgi:hypothetical protein